MTIQVELVEDFPVISQIKRSKFSRVLGFLSATTLTFTRLIQQFSLAKTGTRVPQKNTDSNKNRTVGHTLTVSCRRCWRKAKGKKGKELEEFLKLFDLRFIFRDNKRCKQVQAVGSELYDKLLTRHFRSDTFSCSSLLIAAVNSQTNLNSFGGISFLLPN